MVIFIKEEEEYLAWVANNPAGYIVNIDKPKNTPHYPMVHRTTHKSMSSETRTNYTTGRYFKVCSNDLSELQAWSERIYQKTLTICQSCM